MIWSNIGINIVDNVVNGKESNGFKLDVSCVLLI